MNLILLILEEGGLENLLVGNPLREYYEKM